MSHRMMLFLHFGVAWATLTIPLSQITSDVFAYIIVDPTSDGDWNTWRILPPTLRPELERRLLFKFDLALRYLIKPDKSQLFVDFSPALERIPADLFQPKPEFLETVKQWRSKAAVRKFVEIFPLREDLEWLAHFDITPLIKFVPEASMDVSSLMLWNHLLSDHHKIALGYLISEGGISFKSLPRLPLLRLVNYLLAHLPAIFQRMKVNIAGFIEAAEVFDDSSPIWNHLGLFHVRKLIMYNWMRPYLLQNDKAWMRLCCTYMPKLLQQVSAEEAAELLPLISRFHQAGNRRQAVAPITGRFLETEYRLRVSLLLAFHLNKALRDNSPIGQTLAALLAIQPDFSIGYQTLRRIAAEGLLDAVSLTTLFQAEYPILVDDEMAEAIGGRLRLEADEIDGEWLGIFDALPETWLRAVIGVHLIPYSKGLFFDDQDNPLDRFPYQREVLLFLFFYGLEAIATGQSSAQLDHWLKSVIHLGQAWNYFIDFLNRNLDSIPEANFVVIVEQLMRLAPKFEGISVGLSRKIIDKALFFKNLTENDLYDRIIFYLHQ